MLDETIEMKIEDFWKESPLLEGKTDTEETS